MFCLLGKLRKVAVGGVFYHEAHAVTRTIARNLRHLEGKHPHILDLLTGEVETVHDECQQVIDARTLVPVFQSHYQCGIVGTSTRLHTISAGYGETLQLRNLLHFCLYLLHHLTGLLQCATFRCLQFSQEYTLVLLWHKAGGQALHEEH